MLLMIPFQWRLGDRSSPGIVPGAVCKSLGCFKAVYIIPGFMFMDGMSMASLPSSDAKNKPRRISQRHHTAPHLSRFEKRRDNYYS